MGKPDQRDPDRSQGSYMIQGWDIGAKYRSTIWVKNPDIEDSLNPPRTIGDSLSNFDHGHQHTHTLYYQGIGVSAGPCRF